MQEHLTSRILSTIDVSPALQLFKDGLYYKNGGVKSGFHHVESEAAPEPTLLQIRVSNWMACLLKSACHSERA